MVKNHEGPVQSQDQDFDRSTEAARRRILSDPRFRRIAGFTVGASVFAGAIAGCGPNGEPIETPKPTVTTETPIETPTPTQTAEPTPSPTETEVTISPEVQEKLDSLEAMSSAEFKSQSLEDRLIYQSWVMSTVDKEKFMNKWADINGSPNEAYPGEPSPDDTAQKAFALAYVPYYVAFLRDSGAWGDWEKVSEWDRNRAEKIYASTFLDGDASRFKEAFDWYEGNGKFYSTGQIGGTGTFNPLTVEKSRTYTDDQGRPCRSATFDTGSTYDVCLYDFVDYAGRSDSTWLITAAAPAQK